MVWNRFLYRLGTCFHNTFIPASPTSLQAVPPPKKDQRAIRLDGNHFWILLARLWTRGVGLAQQRHPVAGSRGGGRQGAGPSRARAGEQQLWVKGKQRLTLCKLNTERPDSQGRCTERSSEEPGVLFTVLSSWWEVGGQSQWLLP